MSSNSILLITVSAVYCERTLFITTNAEM